MGTQEIRFGRKTDEIAKFSILDEKTKFTIFDEIWTKNGQLIGVIAEKIVRFFHIHCHYHNAFYPPDVMLARVFATATCPSVRPSVCPSVCHTPVLCLAERKQDREMYTIW